MTYHPDQPHPTLWGVGTAILRGKAWSRDLELTTFPSVVYVFPRGHKEGDEGGQ